MDNTNFRIVGLDPGGTTGWATYSAERVLAGYVNPTWEYYQEEWNCGQLEDKRHHKELYDMLGMFQVETTIIVCESFEFRNQSRVGLELVSREYIGVTELFSQVRPQAELIFQTAAEGKVTKKSFVQRENLQRLGLYVPAHPHAMDAYGHILYYMVNTKIQRDDLLARGWR